MGDSFFNDANMITEIFDNQNNQQVSNLDLTFEKSIEKEQKSSYIHKQKLKNYKKGRKGGFTGSHWDFNFKKSKGQLRNKENYS